MKLYPNEYGERFKDARIGIAGSQRMILENWDHILGDIKYIGRFTPDIHLLFSDAQGRKGLSPIAGTLPSYVSTHPYSQDGKGDSNISNVWMAPLFEAQKLRVKKLLILQSRALLDMDGNLVPYVTHENIEIVSRNLSENIRGQVAKLLGNKDSKDPLKRIHLLNGNQKHAIKNEMFSLDGVGTVIMRDPSEYSPTFSIADENDASSIHELIQPYIKEGLIKKRSQEGIQGDIGNYCKITIDNILAGCVQIMPLDPEAKVVEMGAVAVVDRFKNNQISKNLIINFIKAVHSRGAKAIFVSTRNEKLATILGGFQFDEITPETTPSNVLKERMAKSVKNRFFYLNI